MGIQTKCKKCGTVSPLRTDICDKCGGMDFVPFDNGETRKISEIVDAQEAKKREEKVKADTAKAEAEAKVKKEAEEKSAEEEKKDNKKKEEKPKEGKGKKKGK